LGTPQTTIESRAFSGVLAGALYIALNLVQSIFLVPFFLTYWGKDKYGYFIAILAFVTLVRYIDFGFQNYIGYEFNNLYYSSKTAAGKLLSDGIVFVWVLGCFEILVFVGLYVSGILDILIGLPKGSIQLDMAIGILALIIFWSCLGTITGILVKVILPKGKFTQSTLFACGLKVVEGVVFVYGIAFNSSLSKIFIILAVGSSLYYLFVLIYVKRIMSEYFPWWKKGSVQSGYRLFKRSIGLTVNSILDQYNTTGIILFASAHFSPSLLPSFVTLRTATNAISQVSNIIVNPLQVELIKFHNLKETDKIIQVFKTTWFTTAVLVVIPSMLIMPFIQVLFNWWTKDALVFDMMVYCCLSFAVCLINFGRVYIYYLTGINSIKNILIVTITRFTILFSLILLLTPYGFKGIGVSILLSEVICSIALPIFLVRLIVPEQARQIVTIEYVLMIGFLSVYYVWMYSMPSIYSSICFLAFFLVWVIRLWKQLDLEVRTRLYKMLFKKKPSLSLN
jgi:hypothetical protein